MRLLEDTPRGHTTQLSPTRTRSTQREGRSSFPNRLIGMSGSLLTAEQVAQILGVPKSWVYEQSRRGRIPTVTLGRYRRYREEAIRGWVEKLETGEARS